MKKLFVFSLFFPVILVIFPTAQENKLKQTPLFKSFFYSSTWIQTDTTKSNSHSLDLTISPEMWGASPKASVNTNNAAFKQMQKFIASRGGHVIISFKSNGIYNVGGQTFARTYNNFYAYEGLTLLNLENVSDVIIEGNGCTIKVVNGIKIGSFHPVTGVPVYPIVVPKQRYDTGKNISINVQQMTVSGTAGQTFKFSNGAYFTLNTKSAEGATKLKGNLSVRAVAASDTAVCQSFVDYNYRSAGVYPIRITNCKRIIVRNITLDGNLQGALLGGQWGSRYEVGGVGIQAVEVADLLVDNVRSINNITDGMGLINYACLDTSAIKKVIIRNSKFLYNGRQGFTWDGGNYLVAESCDFSHTGQAINKVAVVRLFSPPSGGIDIEPEVGGCGNLVTNNATFKNCRFQDNRGISFLCVGGAGRASNIFIDGGTIENNQTGAIWANGEKIQFNKVKIVGTVVTGFPASGYNDLRRTKFLQCSFSQQTKDYFRPVDTANHNTHMNRFEHQYALLDHCTFDLGNHAIFIANTELKDCLIKTTSSNESIVHGLHKGSNLLVGSNFNLNAAIKQGVTRIKSAKQ